MIIEALNAGITGAIPALNFKTDKEFRAAIQEIKAASDKPFGINLIVNKSNPNYKQQLNTIVDLKVAFVITSLGSPKEVIKKCKPEGIKVFCDVTDAKYALKVEKLGADALIAVNKNAGGHAGPMTPEQLIPLLKEQCKIPVISAGGVATRAQLDKMLDLGADGISAGTPFIASEECNVHPDYKKAIVDYKASDIVLTTKMSGSPLAVINTPYVEEIGTKANFLESVLNRNKKLKKLVKKIIFNRGMKTMEKAAFSATYKTVWVAGPVIEDIDAIMPLQQIVKRMVEPSND